MEFIASNWIYIVLIVFMIYRMFKGGGCCGISSNDTKSNKGHSHGGGCCGGSFVDNHRDENNEK